MSSAREWGEVKATAALRERIAAAIEAQHVSECQGGVHPEDVMRLADAVIAELDLATPCANTGCRMRQIARRAAEDSSRLVAGDE